MRHQVGDEDVAEFAQAQVDRCFRPRPMVLTYFRFDHNLSCYFRLTLHQISSGAPFVKFRLRLLVTGTPFTSVFWLQIDIQSSLKMPTLCCSTLKRRTNSKAQNALLGKHALRRKTARRLESSPPFDHGLGTLSHLPYELRQIIFERLVPPEAPPAATEAALETHQKATTGSNPRHSTGTSTGLAALLCASKAISTEVRRSFH